MGRYLIFGGTGSLGRKLLERLSCDENNQNDVAVYSRDEAKHWTLKNEYMTRWANGHAPTFFVGDIRDKNRVKDTIRQYQPDTIIVAAALKHVDTCELTPRESILTNTVGTSNVIESVQELESSFLNNVCFVSTDKACSPVNVYGMCKALSERIVTSSSGRPSNKNVRYICVRYGNVLESRGSIIPLFKYQAQNSTEFTVTDPSMTRFVMTLDQSVNLIMDALTNAQNGDIWIPRLPAMKIGDLADLFSRLYNKPIKYIGLRPGEKQHEDLINESESVRTQKVGDYYVIQPAYKQPLHNSRFSYSSNDSVLTKDELFAHLVKLNIFESSLEQFKGLSIEEIRTANVVK